ncbi:DUF2157 domain-containing protein [Winogradskyella sp. SYSU M77433]|uniref:DUF2157 domain-containing protein n=1 Tax=Winogradskyella sp. SYSU M77433 TaxID=3042722 RepID=UPI002480A72D|nr:DUF2157 domain-containing protein [Winogradskyella sp. SYSU M77433]MDH7911779.1 DUF2157 domain-containing protein [Winogradskyella sp. SYSU M77433]
MKSKLLNDISELLENKIISQEVASNITAYYKSKEDDQPNRLFTVFGVLGATLVGLGIILILAHNWDNLSRLIKTVFAFIPLVIAQLVSGYSIYKEKSQVWKESSGTFLFFAIGASIALVSQIYNIPGDLGGFLFTWIVLALPLIYLFNSKAVSILVVIFASYYACELGYDFGYENKTPWLYLVFVIATLPFYLKLLKTSPITNSTSIFNWLYAISFTVVLSAFISSNWSVGFLMYAMLFGVFYNLGKLPIYKNQQLRRNSFTVIGSLGAVVLLIILSFNIVWDEILVLASIAIHTQEMIIATVLFVLAFMILLYTKKKEKAESFNLFQYVFLIVAIIFFIGIANAIAATVLTNILLLVLGLSAIKIGADTFRFSVLNYGLLIVTAVVVCRFFDIDIGFEVKGLLFVAVGFGFFLTNYIMLKKKKELNR